jgi:peptidoglycan hydrolase CwlO-like protein
MDKLLYKFQKPMDKLLYKFQIIGFSALAATLLLSTNAFAMDLPDQATSHLQQGDNAGQTNSQSGFAKARLQDAKLRACQAREKGIKNRSTHLTDLVKNMEDKFDAILQRVEGYYTNTVVPSGKTVSNYDSLVLDIQTKKAAVQVTLTKAQNDVTSFSCTLDNPKETMAKFKDDMQLVKQALKDYRTSIKNLIVAVHSVTGTGEENKNNENQHPNVPANAGQGGNGQ